MTVIAAIEDREGVALAWDTVVSDSDGYIDKCGPKAWLARPWLGIGLAGSIAPELALKHEWTPPAAMPTEVDRWVTYELPKQWREILDPWKDEESTKGEILYPLTALVTLGGLVWAFDFALTAHRSARGYAAIGTGRAWAEGALGALTPADDAREAAKRAVLITCEHCSGVRAPDGPGTLWVPSSY